MGAASATTRRRGSGSSPAPVVRSAPGPTCATAPGRSGTWPGSFWEIPTVNSFESGLEIWKPTIAAVNGHCLGYGLTAASRCDFLIASDRATFGMPEVRLGVPTVVGAMRLAEKLRWADAMELLLTGDPIDADRALEIGLAWRVVPHDDLMAEAHRLAARLLQGAPLAGRAIKEMAARGPKLPWTDAVRMGETMRRVAGGHGRRDRGHGGRSRAADARLAGPVARESDSPRVGVVVRFHGAGYVPRRMLDRFPDRTLRKDPPCPPGARHSSTASTAPRWWPRST